MERHYHRAPTRTSRAARACAMARGARRAPRSDRHDPSRYSPRHRGSEGGTRPRLEGGCQAYRGDAQGAGGGERRGASAPYSGEGKVPHGNAGELPGSGRAAPCENHREDEPQTGPVGVRRGGFPRALRSARARGRPLLSGRPPARTKPYLWVLPWKTPSVVQPLGLHHYRENTMSDAVRITVRVTVSPYPGPKKDVWLRPLRKDWKRTLNRQNLRDGTHPSRADGTFTKRLETHAQLHQILKRRVYRFWLRCSIYVAHDVSLNLSSTTEAQKPPNFQCIVEVPLLPPVKTSGMTAGAIRCGFRHSREIGNLSV